MPFSPKLVTLAVVTLTAALTLGAVPLLRGTLHYPTLTMMVGNELQLNFVKHGVVAATTCEERLARLTNTLQKSCPACRITRRRCVMGLSDAQLRVFSTDPLEMPSARLSDGVVTYVSAVQGLALASCQASERQSAGAALEKRVRCFTAGAQRPRGSSTEKVTLTPK